MGTTAEMLRTDWRGQNPPFSDHANSLAFGSVMLAAFLLMFLSAPGRMGQAITIRSDGWVRQGIFSWRFPGPMTARGAPVYRNTFGIKLIYGKSSIDLNIGDHVWKSQAANIASQITDWARKKISGIPDSGKRYREKSKTPLIALFISIILLAPVISLLDFQSPFADCYLNPYAAPGPWATAITAGFAAVAFAIAGWHGARLAAPIKPSAAVWAMNALIALLLIGAGCIVTLRTGQLLEIRRQSASIATLHQPVSLDKKATKRGCRLYLRIDEPAWQQKILHPVGPCDQLPRWQNAPGIEVRQAESAWGVRILSVRPAGEKP
jgi:hypothetical protein